MKCKTYKKLSKQQNVVFNTRVVCEWISLAIQVQLNITIHNSDFTIEMKQNTTITDI